MSQPVRGISEERGMERRKFADVMRDPGGVHNCSRCRHGTLFHIYDEDGMGNRTLGMTCSDCGRCFYARRPVEGSHVH